MSAQRAAGGFTLVEVLVALAIVAIALLAGTRAASTLTSNAQRQTDIVLAHLCAENEARQGTPVAQMPSVGDSTEICEQAGRQFSVSVIVRPTPTRNSGAWTRRCLMPTRPSCASPPSSEGTEWPRCAARLFHPFAQPLLQRGGAVSARLHAD